MCDTLKSELERKFLWKYGRFQKNRLLPASVLHDDKGLDMWRTMTRLPDYYQTRDEIELLKVNGEDIAMSLGDVDILLDLGCGYVFSQTLPAAA